MDDMTMGRRIAEQRKRIGLSQEALGEKMGVSRQAISKWEADGAVPEIDKLIALSKLYGVSVGWLLGVETQTEKQTDALSDSQLKMVEEIVKRYQPPKSKIPLYNFLVVLVSVIGIVALCVSSWLFDAPSGKDYSSRIANLEAYYNGIDSQLASLFSRIDDLSSAAEKANSPLTGYQFYLEPNADQKVLTVTVEAVPRTWTGSDAATLYVRQNGAYYTSASFQWDGSAHLATVEVAYDNGYEYWMTLQTGPDQRETIQLHNTAAQNPQKEYAITCEVTVGTSRYDQFSHSLNLSDFEVHLCQPYISAHADGQWEYAEWVLYLIRGDRREAVHTKPILYGKEDNFTESWGYLNEGFPLPELQDGDGLELWCRAGLTNGLNASTLACSWACVDGGLIQSVPVNVAEKVE